MKSCIFYLPYELDPIGNRARMLRPRKMIQAFEDIGYEVYVIQGYSDERRKKIQEIKDLIKNGTKFSFMYSEANTEPTLLTDPNHLPTHPFLDFGFFKYIRKQGIPIGLFYGDIFWKFDTYGTHLSPIKRWVAKRFYEYDIIEYRKYLSKLYLPDLEMLDFLHETKLRPIAEELPPGADNLSCEVSINLHRDFSEKPLQLFYVGGIGGTYQNIELIRAASEMENVEMTICCRKDDWQKQKDTISPYLNDSIHIIHESSAALDPYYAQADICCLLFEPSVYMRFAKPFKAFEYLGHERPIVATRGTSLGTFVQKEDIGWTIDYAYESIRSFLNNILSNPADLTKKTNNAHQAKKNNLWISRAEQVEKGLLP